MLELDDGTRLREGPAIVQYLADQAPQKNLAPASGTLQRYRLQEWLTFIGTEIHRSFTPLFQPAMPEEAKKLYRERLANRLQFVNGELADKDYLMGDHFTVADAYLYTVTRWAKPMAIDTSAWPRLMAHHARVDARPAVQEALKLEGLVK
jgi:glutathione S-transferase